jgi:hypothetical protein
MRYLLRGQVVEFDPASSLLNIEIIQNLHTENERLLIERVTALEMMCRSIVVHREHPTLRRADDPRERVIGLQCDCEQPAFEIQMSLTLLLMSSQEIRDVFRRLGPVTLLRPAPSKKDRQRALLADRRASVLLHQMLSREQRWHLRADRSFPVRGQDGKIYLIREGRTVQLLEGGQPTVSYCIHPTEQLPAADVMLVQKLLLEKNIEHFLANANPTPIARAG